MSTTTTTIHHLPAPLFAAPDPATVPMPAWAESVDAFTWVGLPDVWRRCVTRRTGPRVHLWSWQDVAADGSMTSDPPRIDVEDTVIETPKDARELAATILAAADALGGEPASTDRYAHEGTGASARWTGSALLVETAGPVSLNDLRAISEWAGDIEFRLHRDSTPVPPTVCPDWCTASTSIDPWIRDRHEWTFGGVWTRVHHGPVGRVYNEQFEMSAPGGGSHRNRVVRGSAPERRELRDGYWRVLD